MKALPLLLCLSLGTPAFALGLADAPVHRSLLSQTELKSELDFSDTLKLYGAGAATAVIAVPAGLLMGMSLGGISNNLYVAALPAVFSWILIPPIAITLVEWVYGRSMLPDSTRLFPGMLLGIAVNVAIVVASILLGANARNFLHMLAITGVSAAAIPAAVTAFIKKPRETATAEKSWREQLQLQTPQLARTGTLMEVPL